MPLTLDVTWEIPCSLPNIVLGIENGGGFQRDLFFVLSGWGFGAFLCNFRGGRLFGRWSFRSNFFLAFLEQFEVSGLAAVSQSSLVPLDDSRVTAGAILVAGCN